jgi:hypothetical protein
LIGGDALRQRGKFLIEFPGSRPDEFQPNAPVRGKGILREVTLFSSCRDPAQEAIFLTATFPSALSFPFLKFTEQTLL